MKEGGKASNEELPSSALVKTVAEAARGEALGAEREKASSQRNQGRVVSCPQRG